MKVIFTIFSFVTLCTAVEWDKQNTVKRRSGVLSQFDKNEITFDYIEKYFQQECECIGLNDCKPVLDIIIKVRRTPMSHFLMQNLRKAWCGSKDDQPLICCPEKGFSKHTTEAPWIWDVRDNPNIHDITNFHNDSETSDSFIENRFNSFIEEDTQNNLIDFEDPQTHKNCPPSFYSGFDAIGSYYTFKQFFHKYPWGPKPVLQPPYNDLPHFRKKPSKNQHRKTNFRPQNDREGQQPTREQDRRKMRPLPSDENIFNRFGNNRAVVNSPQCGVSVNTRIIGGTDAGPGQFPWMARIAYRNRSSGLLSYRCAGSMINNQYIVTAAHCVTNLVQNLEVYFVRLGELETTRSMDCNIDPINCMIPQDYEIERLIPHPQYDTPKYANDIALIKLITPVNTFDVTPVCLPMKEYAIADQNLTGKLGLVVGWASTRRGTGRRTPTLQYVQLPIVNRTRCAIAYAQFSANSRTPIIVSSAQICAQGRENLDACQGDSGGPLMASEDDTGSRYVLLGLVSFGPRTCGISNFPGVYTRISSYIDWILNNIETYLQDIRGNQALMGGVVLLADDFRQTLPVIERGSPADEMNACLKTSPLPSKVCCPPQSTIRISTDQLVTNNPNQHVKSGGLIERNRNASVELPQPGVCEVPNMNKIYGGNITRVDEFLFMALLEYLKPFNQRDFHCGGSLISKRYVVTAAHCVNGAFIPADWKLISVRLGEWDIDSKRDCDENDCSDPPQDVEIEKAITHEGYDRNSLEQYNDIAMLRLVRDIMFSDWIKPICLPTASNFIDATFEGNILQVGGWDRYKMKGYLEVVPIQSCNQVYVRKNITVQYSQICAGSRFGVDSCSGDSGGPLIGLNIENKRRPYYFLGGIVSFGPAPCALKDWPGVYTRVGHYIDWIESNISL